MSEPAYVRIVPRELLLALAAEVPDPAKSDTTKSRTEAGGEYASRLLVEKWLMDRRIEFRVKAEPDGAGRTVYVLKECPFDAGHGDPDSCIMQASSGKMSAQCFHDSCEGRGWQTFKTEIGPPNAHHYDPPLVRRRNDPRARMGGRSSSDHASAPTEPASNDSAGDETTPPKPPDEGGAEPHVNKDGVLPTIQGNKRQLREITADALAAVLARNDPPTVFVRGRVLTRLKDRDTNDPPMLEPLTDDALRGVLTRVADWTTIRNTQRGGVEEPAPPPMAAVKDLATLPTWPALPALTAVVESPVFAADGTLVNVPGYCPRARLWYSPVPGFDVPDVPDAPTTEDIQRARHLLELELLGDFPFADEASRAHAVAALLLPFVRPMIDGPTPLHLLDAPVEGTGKTLLASAVALVSTGRDVEAVAEASDNEEWRKRITAILAEGPTFVLLDNLNRVLDSGALASALTTRVWKDRILGVSKTASLPVTCVWLASGNNTRLSREMIRRTVFCRLDAKVDTPWLRADFRHADLLAWARAHRGELVWAALTLVRAWLAAGRPPGTARLGMYEAWAAAIGGILDAAGIPGLLTNAREFRSARADQVGEWRAFVAAWWAKFADKPVGVHDLFAVVTAEALLDHVLGDKGERSQRTRLGVELVRAADRVFGEYRLERAGTDNKDRQLYRLTRVSVPPAADEEEWSA